MSSVPVKFSHRPVGWLDVKAAVSLSGVLVQNIASSTVASGNISREISESNQLYRLRGREYSLAHDTQAHRQPD